MLIHQRLIVIVGILLLLSSLPLAADYYLLTQYQGDISEQLVAVLKAYGPWIIVNRTVSIVLYYLLVLLIVRLPRYKGPQHRVVSVPMAIQVIALVGFAASAWWFVNFERSELSFSTFYPVALGGWMVLLPWARVVFPRKRAQLGSLVKRRKVNNRYSIHFKTLRSKWINVLEPFRHTIIIAGSGSGKTESLVRPFLKQFIAKGYCGILYDYKFPALTNELNTMLVHRGKKAKHKLYVLDFDDLTRCHRVNPIKPVYVKTINHAEEIATSIYNNLDMDTAKKGENFFSRSAINWLTAVIWFYKVKHPDHCTLPHVFNTIMHPDYQHVFSMLLSEPTCADYVSSITTAMDTGADRQLGGQISSLKNVIAKLNTPKLNWTLSGDDFDLDINDPENPKLLSIGMTPSIRKSLAPIISSVFTVALQQMNNENKHHSFLMLDEAPTVFIEDLDHIGAVARSNKIALVYVAQDISMMIDRYGTAKTQTIIANMNNKFFGRINLPETAKVVSETIGKEQRELVSKSEGMSYAKQSSGSLSHNFSVQDRVISKTEDVMTLKRGEFIGRTTDEKQAYFWARFKRHTFRKFYRLRPFVHFIDTEQSSSPVDLDTMVQVHASSIKAEVETIINGYVNVYAKNHASSTQLSQPA